MKRKQLKRIALAVATGDKAKAIRTIDYALRGETGVNWRRDLTKLKDVIRNDVARFTVIKRDGNSKLPFAAYSSLAGFPFCIGAGDCLNWCYSFRAWRYPSAFCRQAQNSWLNGTARGRLVILESLDKLEPKDGSELDFRLFVDGDFSSLDDLHFWLDALRVRPWLRAYGYSKSFELFLEYDGEWPSNYVLNLSGGHKYTGDVVKAMRELPIVRGEFIAVPLGRKVHSEDHANPTHQRELRKAFRDHYPNERKPFTCMGKCGECTTKGHACGSRRFQNVPIIIATH